MPCIETVKDRKLADPSVSHTWPLPIRGSALGGGASITAQYLIGYPILEVGYPISRGRIRVSDIGYPIEAMCRENNSDAPYLGTAPVY